MMPTTLDQLFRLMKDDPENPTLGDWTDLPLFSEREWVGDTAEIWSWDDDHCIVGTSSDNLEIEPRADWDRVEIKR